MMSATTGCVLFLIDESIGMAKPVMGTETPRQQMMATGLNGLIKAWAGLSQAAVSVLGYRSVSGVVEVTSRWGGSHAGRDFVPLQELVTAPARVEKRIRKLPSPNPLIPPVEQSIDFPVWYEPGASMGEACQQAAFQQAHLKVEDWLRQAGAGTQAIIVHIFSSTSADGNPGKIIKELLQTSAGACQLWNLHLGQTANVPPTLYPSTKANLPLGTVTDWFDRSSKLHDGVLASLKQNKQRVLPGAKGLVCNATALEAFQMLQLLKPATEGWVSTAQSHVVAPPAVDVIPLAEPSSAEPAPTMSSLFGDTSSVPEEEPVTVLEESPQHLVVLLLDRSTADPYASTTVWNKIQERANDLLSQAVKSNNGDTSVAVILYGGDDTNQAEVMSGFQGELSSQLYATTAELGGKELRVHEFDEEIPNGVGGLLTLHRTRHIFIEVEPKAACSPQGAVDAALNTIADWRDKYTGRPVVIHLTRGGHAAGDMGAWSHFFDSTLYHWIFPEGDVAAMAYPETAESITTPELQGYFHSASSLADLSARKARLPKLSDNARGLVINSKFDFVWPVAAS